ncbi:MAG: GNAT family N-acetyltransferase [Rhodanobacter sp.]
MTAELNIRVARPTDAEALVALLDDTYRSTWRPHLRPEAAERFEREDRTNRYVAEYIDQFWIAARDHTLCGMVHWRDDFLEALHVSTSHQGQGIGAALLYVAETRMAMAGVSLARLETDTFNLRSRDFYRKHSYQEVAEYPDLEWDSGFTTVLLHKSLLKSST